MSKLIFKSKFKIFKLIFKSKFKILTVLLLMFTFSACSNSTIEEAQNENNLKQDLETIEVADDNVSESSEDLFTVDYKEFHDLLAPHGEWIEVNGDEINVNLNDESSSSINPGLTKKISLSGLFGINDAHASDINVNSFFVWKPSSDMAISISANTNQPAYVPYSNGQWINTDRGWYFKAPTPHEEVVHHYGRWVNSPSIGWVWVPGNVWAPAWVDWKINDSHIAWAPVPYGINIVAGEIPPVQTIEYDYVIVEKKYFFEPVIYKHIIYEPVIYKHIIYEPETVVMIKSMNRPKGLVLVNNVIINKGPEIGVFDPVLVASVPTVKIHKVKDIKKIKFFGNDIYTYTPVFKKIKGNKPAKFSHFKPEKYSKYNEVFDKYKNHSQRYSAGKNEKKEDKKVELRWKKKKIKK